MRITGGQYRGRTLYVPKGKNVRPTTDKVRQAVFNIINGYAFADHPFVLDGFCGTGALGLEALSRFARGALFVDQSGESLKFCQKNIDNIGIKKIYKVMRQDVTKLNKRPVSIDTADLVFLDPPYRLGLLPPALAALDKGDWLADDALCILECEKEAVLDLPARFVIRDDRTYGDCRIVFMRYNAR